MATFRDGNGREWHISVTVAAVKRVKESTGVHLTQLVEDKFQPLANLIADPLELVNVVFVLIQKQADAAGVTDEMFGESLTGNSLEDMTSAFVQALIDFFPKRQSQLLQTLVSKIEKIQEAALAKAEAEMAAKTDEQLISSVLTSLESSG